MNFSKFPIRPSLFIVLSCTACAQFQDQPKTVAGTITNPEAPSAKCQLQLHRDIAIGSENDSTTAFGNIIAYTVGSDGTMYIIDATNPAVSIYNATGTFRRKVGKPGRGPAEFQKPYRIAVSGDRMVIFDRELARFVTYDTTGKHISTGPAPFAGHPNLTLTIGPANRIYVGAAAADSSLSGQIQELDSTYALIQSFGAIPKDFKPDEAIFPAWGDIRTDSAGNVWFSAAQSYEIRRYSPRGDLELTISRAHNFDFNPRPYLTTKELEPGKLTQGFDANRPVSTKVVVDTSGYVWHFLRDVPHSTIVVDVFDPKGKFILSNTWPLKEGPGSMDIHRIFYRVSLDSEFPQLIRFRASNLNEGGHPCASAD